MACDSGGQASIIMAMDCKKLDKHLIELNNRYTLSCMINKIAISRNFYIFSSQIQKIAAPPPFNSLKPVYQKVTKNNYYQFHISVK